MTDKSVITYKQLIYSQISAYGTLSKADILSMNKLTSSTLTRLLEDLVSEGLVLEDGLGPSNGGRKPILYRINRDYRYIFGLDISRFSSTLGLFDLELNAKSLARWRMDEGMKPEVYVRHAAALMKNIMKDHSIKPERILGLGIGAVGPLDRRTGIIEEPLYFAADGWNQVRIVEMFEQATGFRASLENGANAALKGEAWSARNEPIEHALYVHAGVSLRSAMMTNGRIVYGKYDTEGSIGQMIIHTDGPRLHASGNYGALEAYCSVQAIVNQARAHVKMGNHSLAIRYSVSPDRIDLDLLLQALSDQDPYVQELFQTSAAYFGIGLANLINLYHPEVVFLGGVLITSVPNFYSTATDVAIKNIFHSPRYAPRFSRGILAEDAAVTGAAIGVRDHWVIS